MVFSCAGFSTRNRVSVQLRLAVIQCVEKCPVVPGKRETFRRSNCFADQAKNLKKEFRI